MSQSHSIGPVSRYLREHFRHFNAGTVIDAADGWKRLVEGGGRMMLTLAGAMSTAELGRSLAEMIRAGKVHAITCTGANLEEDLFNLVAHEHYERVPHWRDLTAEDEQALFERGMNRVTDTCIPEAEAMRHVEAVVIDEWLAAEKRGERLFPHEFLYRALNSGKLEDSYQIDPKNSWLLAAAEKELPIWVPGWEDSTLGNVFASHVIAGKLRNVHTVRTGVEAMVTLTGWYESVSRKAPIGFFQIGGGIAGDFPICVVPLLEQDLKRERVAKWAYFAQIGDSTTSYGSYSGAIPNEKITWGKLAPDTPKFMIESDASIVAPLVFALVMGV